MKSSKTFFVSISVFGEQEKWALETFQVSIKLASAFLENCNNNNNNNNNSLLPFCKLQVYKIQLECVLAENSKGI